MSRVETCREIVRTHVARKVDGVLVDVQTANAIVTVADALSPENRARMDALRIDRAAVIAWRFVA